MGILIFVLYVVNVFGAQQSFFPIFTEKYLFSKNDVSYFFLCCCTLFDFCQFYSFTRNFQKKMFPIFSYIWSVLLEITIFNTEIMMRKVDLRFFISWVKRVKNYTEVNLVMFYNIGLKRTWRMHSVLKEKKCNFKCVFGWLHDLL